MKKLLLLLLFICNLAWAIDYNPNGTTGLNLTYNGNYDDGFVTVNLPWSISFLGTNYSSVHVGTNGYVTFASGNSTYYSFSASNPSGPHISIYPADRRLYTIYSGEIGAGTASAHFVIRVAGVDYSNAGITHVYELHFYPNSNNIDVFFVDAPSSGNQNGGISAVSNGTTYVATFDATEGTAIRITTDGTISNDAPTTSTTTGSSPGMTGSQSSNKAAARSRRDSYNDNGIYIDQTGSNNNISITQSSSDNQIRGINQQKAKMWGDSNTIDIRQGASTTIGINLIEFMLDGNSNTITLYQDRNDDGSQDASAYGGHVIKSNIDGNLNDVSVIQRNNTTYSQGHFVDLNVVGNSNVINLKQISDYGKDIFASVTGNSNSITVYQHDNANHFADITLTGNGHTVNLEQSGTGVKNATIDLTYGSASSTLNLNQFGSTPQSYSFTQTCYDLGGCSATVTQQ